MELGAVAVHVWAHDRNMVCLQGVPLSILFEVSSVDLAFSQGLLISNCSSLQ